mmetsp:Transcript_20744/g.61338  ORF Transcript_20744/g.61338 Transcript_20744/m.61338 type:complete len:732 (+) Transcript_20744:3514-5709(+)
MSAAPRMVCRFSMTPEAAARKETRDRPWAASATTVAADKVDAFKAPAAGSMKTPTEASPPSTTMDNVPWAPTEMLRSSTPRLAPPEATDSDRAAMLPDGASIRMSSPTAAAPPASTVSERAVTFTAPRVLTPAISRALRMAPAPLASKAISEATAIVEADTRGANTRFAVTLPSPGEMVTLNSLPGTPAEKVKLFPDPTSAPAAVNEMASPTTADAAKTVPSTVSTRAPSPKVRVAPALTAREAVASIAPTLSVPSPSMRSRLRTAVLASASKLSWVTLARTGLETEDAATAVASTRPSPGRMTTPGAAPSFENSTASASPATFTPEERTLSVARPSALVATKPRAVAVPAVVSTATSGPRPTVAPASTVREAVTSRARALRACTSGMSRTFRIEVPDAPAANSTRVRLVTRSTESTSAARSRALTRPRSGWMTTSSPAPLANVTLPPEAGLMVATPSSARPTPASAARTVPMSRALDATSSTVPEGIASLAMASRTMESAALAPSLARVITLELPESAAPSAVSESVAPPELARTLVMVSAPDAVSMTALGPKRTSPVALLASMTPPAKTSEPSPSSAVNVEPTRKLPPDSTATAGPTPDRAPMVTSPWKSVVPSCAKCMISTADVLTPALRVRRWRFSESNVLCIVKGKLFSKKRSWRRTHCCVAIRPKLFTSPEMRASVWMVTDTLRLPAISAPAPSVANTYTTYLVKAVRPVTDASRVVAPVLTVFV